MVGMDPNETLRLYREAQARALAVGDASAAREAFLEADRHMANLLGWLAKGGFPPDWTAARGVAGPVGD